MRFVLTWGHGQPPGLDLDIFIDFYDANGEIQCHVYYSNKKCGDYGSLDMEQDIVSSIE